MRTRGWTRLGRVVAPEIDLPSGYSHASVPVAVPLGGDLVRLLFSSRDAQGRSQPFAVDCRFRDGGLVSRSPVVGPLLETGELGTFDDSGVMPTCALVVSGEVVVYYIGWNLGVTVPFRNAVGLARWGTLDSHVGAQGAAIPALTRVFDGPVLDRTAHEPHFVASCDVLRERDRYRCWYLSCVGWRRDPGGKAVHRYLVRYAESADGIRWERTGRIAIGFADESEYAISTPRVVSEPDGRYRMWFSVRGEAYRIGHARSDDGIEWRRSNGDEELSADPSEPWANELVCYPCIVDVSGSRWLFYNGNGFGRTGIGLARWDG